MNIYLSSSWKNRIKVREIATRLSNMGHYVYDFTNPACRKTPELPPEKMPEQFDPALHVYRHYIDREVWRAAVNGNRQAIKKSDFIILLLPCGNDSHADWALGVGLGKRSVVVGRPQKGDRSPVHLWADAILDDEAQLYEYVKENNICMGKIETLNALEVVDASCSGGELEYVYAENTKENIQLLLKAGFTKTEIESATIDDGECIEISSLAFDSAAATWWSNKSGFTTVRED